jgi:glycogen(starch) synthase
VAAHTAQVYLAAKRREREPQARRTIVEQALPGRG